MFEHTCWIQGTEFLESHDAPARPEPTTARRSLSKGAGNASKDSKDLSLVFC